MSATITVPATEPVTPPAPTPEPTPQAEQPSLTQAQFNTKLAEERRAWEAKAQRDAEAAATKAKDATLREQGEFKTLAEERAARITELESETATITTLTEERDALSAVVADLVKAELKDAPVYVAEAIADRSPVDQLRYIEKHRASWQEALPRGGRETSRPAAGNLSRDDQIQQEYEAQRAGRYVR